MSIIDKNLIWYLAGPMTGVPFANFPLFNQVAAELRAAGYAILSPAELDDPVIREESGADETGSLHASQWGEFLSRDVKLIADGVGGVILLPRWEKSRGAKLEAFVGLLTGKTFAAWYPEGVAPLPRICVQQTLRENMP